MIQRVALLVGCSGCLNAEQPDGVWRALTSECVPLAEEPTLLLRNHQFLHSFVVAGDTVVFDDDGGLAQLSLRDGSRSIIAYTNSDDATEFQTMADDLVYYARSDLLDVRDLIADRGIDAEPRWLKIASLSTNTFTLVLANRAGVHWRIDGDDRWRRWDRSTNELVSTPLPFDSVVTTDGNQFFYKAQTTPRRELYTVPVEGGTPTLVAILQAFDDSVQPVGIVDGRPFAHVGTSNMLVEILPDLSWQSILTIPALGAPARRTFGGGYFYWVPIITGADTIRRVSLDGGPQQSVGSIEQDGELGTLQADACNVYWQVVRQTGVDLWAMRH